MQLHFNNNFVDNLQHSDKKYYNLYHLDNIKQPFLEFNNIQIIDNGKIIHQHNILPQCENFNDLVNGQYKFNCDMYEQLIPLKYSVCKENNQLFLKSIEFTKF